MTWFGIGIAALALWVISAALLARRGKTLRYWLDRLLFLAMVPIILIDLLIGVPRLLR